MKNPVILHSAITYRGETNKVLVEVEVSSGIGIRLVGMADSDTLLRVLTAIQYCGYHFPGKKVVINVRGVDRYLRPKAFGWLDFPIAIGILLASGQIDASEEEIKNIIFVGEAGIDGSLLAPGGKGGFVSDRDAALAVSWKYRDDFSVWGWDCDCETGNNWLDVKGLKDAVKLLENTIEKEENQK